MAEFRRHTGDLRSTFEGHLRDLEREAESRRIAAVLGSGSVGTACRNTGARLTWHGPIQTARRPPPSPAQAEISFLPKSPIQTCAGRIPGTIPISPARVAPGGPPDEPPAPEPETPDRRMAAPAPPEPHLARTPRRKPAVQCRFSSIWSTFANASISSLLAIGIGMVIGLPVSILHQLYHPAHAGRAARESDRPKLYYTHPAGYVSLIISSAFTSES